MCSRKVSSWGSSADWLTLQCAALRMGSLARRVPKSSFSALPGSSCSLPVSSHLRPEQSVRCTQVLVSPRQWSDKCLSPVPLSLCSTHLEVCLRRQLGFFAQDMNPPTDRWRSARSLILRWPVLAVGNLNILEKVLETTNLTKH